MENKLTNAYWYAQDLRAEVENHSWCRRQTGYDSAFIAKMNSRLMVMCNKIYELTRMSAPGVKE